METATPWTEISRGQYAQAGLRYASDLSDAEWEIVAPWSLAPGGQWRESFRRSIAGGMIWMRQRCRGGAFATPAAGVARSLRTIQGSFARSNGSSLRIAEVDGHLEPGHQPPIGVHGRGADRQQSRRVAQEPAAEPSGRTRGQQSR